MRLFLYEDICGGSGAVDHAATSLQVEGRTMLAAIVEDFIKLGDASPFAPFEIVTHWNSDLNDPPFETCRNLHVVKVDTHADDQFVSTAESCDASLIIAPECDGRLQTLLQILDEQNCESLNSSVQAVATCSDKLALFHHLCEHKLPTIPTFLATDETVQLMLSGAEHIVIKPRDGAGSANIRTLPNKSMASGLPNTPDRLIVQPMIKGVHISIGCFHDSPSGQLECLAVATQRLSLDGQYRYLGGTVPAESFASIQLESLMRQLVESLPGLHGYFGVDLLIQNGDCPLIVEVNPRLTTSYVGARKATKTNLARYFFANWPDVPIHWNQRVDFTPDGRLTSRPLEEVKT